MPDPNTEMAIPACPGARPAAPVVINAQDARQGEPGTSMLYVLCLGIAAALMANAMIIIGFAESGALG